MAISRYDKRAIAVNKADSYKELFQKRGIRFVRQYRTPSMIFPTDEEQEQIEAEDYIWRTSDRFYKLAHSYYGDSKYWWIIAWYNQKPTESHLNLGDVIQIPISLNAVLRLFLGKSS